MFTSKAIEAGVFILNQFYLFTRPWLQNRVLKKGIQCYFVETLSWVNLEMHTTNIVKTIGKLSIGMFTQGPRSPCTIVWWGRGRCMGC